jgi:hypothetical protein
LAGEVVGVLLVGIDDDLQLGDPACPGPAGGPDDPFCDRWHRLGWGAVDRAPLTEVGQIFRMDMYHANHPNGGYQVANKVQVLDPPRAIGWLTGQDKGDGHLEFGGWIWRYDLAPLGPSETEVTLTYDWSAVPQFIRDYLQFPPFGPEHLTNSLHHLAELAAPTSRAWTPGGETSSGRP